jgi:hypothetical protein
MRPLDFALIIIALGIAFWGGVVGTTHHLLSRYLKNRYPNHWKDLGAPDLYTAQGRRPSPIRKWLRTNRYQRLHDPHLDKWVPILQKLPRRLGLVVGAITLGTLVAALVALNLP